MKASNPFNRNSRRLIAALPLLLFLFCEIAAAIPVTLTITRIRANDLTADSGLEALGESTADLYVVAAINGVLGNNFDQHIDDDPDVEPFWSFSVDVDPALGTVPVLIQVWDHDDTSDDDQADADPGPGRDIDLVVDLSTGTWSGDSSTDCLQQGTPNTEGSEGVLTCWSISIFSSSGDADNDGLLDGWEVSGLDFDGNGSVDLDLPAFGADPLHKDLFLEMDWVDGQEPTRFAIQTLKAAFAAAPLDAGGSANPDALPGINLWVDTGNITDPTASEDGGAANSCSDGSDNGGDGVADANDPDCLVGDNLGGGGSVGGPGLVGCLDLGFYAAKQAFFDNNRRWVFRYAIMGDPADNTPCNGGRGEIGGNDFVDYNHDAGTLMHELGHNLNLRHGGNNSNNCKPNYVSTMNYDHQFGIPQAGGTAIIDYSPPRFAGGRGLPSLPTLVEDNLDETMILDASDAVNRFIYVDTAGNKIQWQLNGQDIDGDGVIDGVDWDSDGTPGETGQIVNIDTNATGGGPADCANATSNDTLTGFDDWSNISLAFRQFGDSADAAINPVNEPEMTTSELIQVQQQLNTTDVAIDKGAAPDPVEVGDDLVYTLTVTNNGPNPASVVRVTDDLPALVDYLSDDGGCVLQPDGSLACELGELLQAQSAAIDVVVGTERVCVDGVPQTITNEASVANLAQFAVELDPANDIAFSTVIPVDTTPPQIVSGPLLVSPTSLAPPNHRLVSIEIPTIVAEDVCDDAPLLLCSVDSDEPANGNGDGNTDFDIVFDGSPVFTQGSGLRQIASVDGAGSFSLELRAERAGPQDGRTYTISCVAQDAQGNTSDPLQATVEVPHRSQGAKN